jgi:hypothetical protein
MVGAVPRPHPRMQNAKANPYRGVGRTAAGGPDGQQQLFVGVAIRPGQRGGPASGNLQEYHCVGPGGSLVSPSGRGSVETRERLLEQGGTSPEHPSELTPRLAPARNSGATTDTGIISSW